MNIPVDYAPRTERLPFVFRSEPTVHLELLAEGWTLSDSRGVRLQGLVSCVSKRYLKSAYKTSKPNSITIVNLFPELSAIETAFLSIRDASLYNREPQSIDIRRWRGADAAGGLVGRRQRKRSQT